MQLVAVPATAAQLDAVTHVHADHRRLGLEAPLEPGQVLVLRDLDGALRWAMVEGLDLDLTSTTYRLQLGYPTDETTLRQYAGTSVRVPRPRASVCTADVVEALGQLATVRALAGALERVTPTGA